MLIIRPRKVAILAAFLLCFGGVSACGNSTETTTGDRNVSPLNPEQTKQFSECLEEKIGGDETIAYLIEQGNTWYTHQCMFELDFVDLMAPDATADELEEMRNIAFDESLNPLTLNPLSPEQNKQFGECLEGKVGGNEAIAELMAQNPAWYENQCMFELDLAELMAPYATADELEEMRKIAFDESFNPLNQEYP